MYVYRTLSLIFVSEDVAVFFRFACVLYALHVSIVRGGNQIQ